MAIKENAGAYIGDGGQLRLDPVRRFRWGREGQHALVGALVVVPAALAYALGSQALWWASMAVMQPLALVMFLAYEITEGLRINDWAYRDIGGYMAGWLFAMSVFVGLACALPW